MNPALPPDAPNQPEEALSGGSRSDVARRGERVHRLAGPWTPRVHALLAHLRAQGLHEAPEPFGFDEQGREVLSFLPGLAGNDPLPAALRAPELLQQAARLLRRLHDAAPASLWPLEGWRLPALQPAEVICHGDFAPYNCVYQDGRLTGVIDFDYAHPAPRAWDLAYALYRFAPLAAASNPDGYGTLSEQLARARLFMDAYGLEERGGLSGWVERCMEGMIAIPREGAARGDAHILANTRDGHMAIYENDLAYLRAGRDEFLRVLET